MRKTDLTKLQAEKYLPKITTFFSLGKIINAKYLPEALANHNWKVTTEKNDYIIKILVELSREGLKNYIAIQQQLNKQNVNAPTFSQTTHGEIIFQEDDILAVVFPIIEGRYPPVLDEKFCYAIGRILAIFHTSVTDLPFNYHAWLSYRNTNNLISSTTNKKLITQANLFVEESKKIFDQHLPQGIIH